MSEEEKSADDPLLFVRPLLLRHSPASQVIECDAIDNEDGFSQPCVLKFFAPKAEAAFRRELAVYTKTNKEEILGNVVPLLLWEGEWSSAKYKTFIGNFPTLLRKSDRAVKFLAIHRITNTVYDFPTGEPVELQPYAVKTALHGLQILHSFDIVHGDVSVQNLLLRRNSEYYDALWIDFSSSIVDASEQDMRYEWQKAVQYFSNLIGEEPATILPDPQDDQINFAPEHLPLADDLSPLRELDSAVKFHDCQKMSEGTHARIYRAIATDKSGVQSIRCLKIFGTDWMTPFNLECTAYAYLIQSQVDTAKEGVIPKVYGWSRRTLYDWGVNERRSSDREDTYYGIAMEWIEGACHLSENNATIELAANLVIGLAKIHEAKVLHGDLFSRNMLVVPDTERAVWIDFSCARIRERAVIYEQEFASATKIAIEMVADRMRHEEHAKLCKDTIWSRTPSIRRISAIFYSAWLLLQFLYFLIRPPSVDSPLRSWEPAYIYVVGFVIFVSLMHSFIGNRGIPKIFRLTIFFHQLCVMGSALRQIPTTNDFSWQLWLGFKLGLMAFCAVCEFPAFYSDINDMLGFGD